MAAATAGLGLVGRLTYKVALVPDMAIVLATASLAEEAQVSLVAQADNIVVRHQVTTALHTELVQQVAEQMMAGLAHLAAQEYA
jgi:hypothetical protein